ncbi:aspartyl/asparaginyl-tRNA synthetase [Cenarchaeum symbiosum A]|uniref:Aspartate--tRNA(Asp/Asn) ligase n=1 Tax=Cenarchaeum symbiosum (strain A) TaxID=414004 RepID=A0RU66_CENSY|nr:aspartyl/asparaginyl-tRNA synthetase [Cenarchaeum symbiosum A]
MTSPLIPSGTALSTKSISETPSGRELLSLYREYTAMPFETRAIAFSLDERDMQDNDPRRYLLGTGVSRRHGGGPFPHEKVNYAPVCRACMEDSLGGLRRTHYSSGLGPSMDGKDVTVMGWVMAVRGHGAISFMTIRDRDGRIQVVAKSGSCPDETRERISGLKPHSVVAVTGTVRASEKAPSGFELVPNELKVFADVQKIPPFEPQAKTVKNIETRLEIRPIDLRRDALLELFHARSAVLRETREYFYENGFVEASTPKMISTATEGGAALFPIFYYNKEAFLAQSPQLYKEQLTMSLERVFEIGPIFRAEPSRTNRHLAEAISIDLEEAFVDYNDIMDRISDIVKRAASAATPYAGGPGAQFAVPDVPAEIPRYTYADLLDRIKGAGAKAEWGDDLYPSALKKAGLEGFYFITDWPAGPKPFYVKVGPDGRTSESFDLMFGDLEISSGSTRIDNRAELEERMAAKGMNAGSFGHHLAAFDYGVPPHAGCGIGLERLMMALTGTENIRDVTFYPRDVDRLTP